MGNGKAKKKESSLSVYIFLIVMVAILIGLVGLGLREKPLEVILPGEGTHINLSIMLDSEMSEVCYAYTLSEDEEENRQTACFMLKPTPAS